MQVRKKKPKRKKKISGKKAEEKKVKTILGNAWNYQSKYIRVHAKGICRTCGKQEEPLARKMNAGHTIHTGKGYSLIDFNYTLQKIKLPPNIYCQCVKCNMEESGEMLREFLRDGNTLEQYDQMRILKMQVWKPSIDEAEEIRDHYKELCIQEGIPI